MKFSYTYAVLRYYHDIATGECLNVGVALVSPEARFVGARCSLSAERPARVFPNVKQESLVRALNAIQMSFAKLNDELHSGSSPIKNISEFTRLVLPADDSSLKWESFGSGLTEDPEQELLKLYERMVGRNETPENVRDLLEAVTTSSMPPNAGLASTTNSLWGLYSKNFGPLQGTAGLAGFTPANLTLRYSAQDLGIARYLSDAQIADALRRFLTNLTVEPQQATSGGEFVRRLPGSRYFNDEIEDERATKK